jgi:cytochrome c
MPWGKGGTLSELEAWDVAAFVNSHERLQDRQRARAWEALKWSPAQALQTHAS